MENEQIRTARRKRENTKREHVVTFNRFARYTMRAISERPVITVQIIIVSDGECRNFSRERKKEDYACKKREKNEKKGERKRKKRVRKVKLKI